MATEPLLNRIGAGGDRGGGWSTGAGEWRGVLRTGLGLNPHAARLCGLGEMTPPGPLVSLSAIQS